MTEKRVDEWKRQIAAALIETSEKVIDYLNKHPEDKFDPIADRMLELWAIELETHNRKASQHITNNRPRLES